METPVVVTPVVETPVVETPAAEPVAEEAKTETAPAAYTQFVYVPLDDNAEVNGVKAADQLPMTEAMKIVGDRLDGENVSVEVLDSEKLMDAAQKAAREQKAKYRLVCRGCGQETLYLREGKIIRLIASGRESRVRCTRCQGNRFDLYVRES